MKDGATILKIMSVQNFIYYIIIKMTSIGSEYVRNVFSRTQQYRVWVRDFMYSLWLFYILFSTDSEIKTDIKYSYAWVFIEE